MLKEKQIQRRQQSQQRYQIPPKAVFVKSQPRFDLQVSAFQEFKNPFFSCETRVIYGQRFLRILAGFFSMAGAATSLPAPEPNACGRGWTSSNCGIN
ncbi:MAG: hypothetical protein HGA76_01240 [Candidatus Firestonebacteria bacterium]|nr:hypothetical protein [Candidatus Firestonebacteria bacterium]